jgi:hypothetical protein
VNRDLVSQNGHNRDTPWRLHCLQRSLQVAILASATMPPRSYDSYYETSVAGISFCLTYVILTGLKIFLICGCEIVCESQLFCSSAAPTGSSSCYFALISHWISRFRRWISPTLQNDYLVLVYCIQVYSSPLVILRLLSYYCFTPPESVRVRRVILRLVMISEASEVLDGAEDIFVIDIHYISRSLSPIFYITYFLRFVEAFAACPRIFGL